MELTLEERVAALEQKVRQLEEKPSRTKFVKPTYDEVYEHMEKCLTRAIGMVKPAYVEEQANLFIHHYEANGWKVGSVKMKSWQHAISGTWVTNIKNKKYGKNNNGDHSEQPLRGAGHGKGRFGKL